MATPRISTTSLPRQMPPPRDRDDQNSTSFSDLPAEMRNEIYRMALCKTESIKIVRLYELDKPKPEEKTVEWAWPRKPKRLLSCPEKAYDRDLIHDLATGPPGILLASKQIRFEASQIYYLGNTFCFVESALDEDAIARFFDQVGKLYTKFLHVEVFRNNRFGHLKQPSEVRFTARADHPSGFVVVQYKPYDEKVMMPGFAVKIDPFVEPCRCRVRRYRISS